jgi:hypothetical protein
MILEKTGIMYGTHLVEILVVAVAHCDIIETAVRSIHAKLGGENRVLEVGIFRKAGNEGCLSVMME